MRSTTLQGWAAGLAVVAAACLPTRPAAAQYADPGSSAPLAGGVLPAVGSGTTVGDLRPQLERYFQPSVLPATTPTFLLQKSIGVDVGVTDNALRVNAPRRADLYTVISPVLTLTQDSARIKTNITYAPQVQVYASQSSQTQVSQFFNGQSLVTLAPDALYLDLRGAITQSSLVGSGFNNGQTSTYNRQNEVQTTSFSVTPYAEHRFGGWGTARIGYSYVRTLQDTDNGVASNSGFDQFGNPISGNQGYGGIGNLTTQRERVSFATGENLGRFNDLTTLEAIQYSGSGSYAGSHRNQALSELGFALTRRVTLLGGLGYQDILYSGGRGFGSQSDVRINEPTWNVGVRYTPNPDSTITVTYGRRDGSASVTLNGQFAPTSRSRVIAQYSTGITSDIEDAQNLLESTSVGPNGFVTDTVTGAPVSGGSAFGVQNGVYRVRRLSVTALYLANRDSYSATIGQEDRTTLTTTTSVFGGATIPSGTSTNNLYGSVGWQHDLAADLSSNVSVQYGTTNNTSQLLGGNGNNGRQDTFSILASLNKQFTKTLTGNVRYIYSQRTGGTGNVLSQSNTNNYTENVFLIGLRKSF